MASVATDRRCKARSAPLGQLALASALALHAGGGAAQAADTPAPNGISAFTRVGSVGLVATDNDRSSGGEGGSDLIGTASAGFRWRRTTGALTGSADYSLTGVTYAQEPSDSNFQNTLAANARAEVIDGRFFVDATGVVTRQLISAFGNRSADVSLQRNNRAEVASFSVSPFVRGVLGGAASYEARLSHVASFSDEEATSDSSSSSASLLLGSVNTQGLLSWSTSYVHRSVDFSNGGRRTEADTARAVLTFRPDPRYSLSAIGGYESNDYVSLERQGRSTYGAGLTWLPTGRTRLAAEYERRFFGDAHNLTFEHRTRRTAVQLSSSRSVVIDPERLSTRGFGRLFDLFFLQFASIEPDPVRRELLVNNFLAANGLNPDTVVVGGFLSSGVLLERRQEVTLSLLGVRDTVTLALTRSTSNRLDQAVSVNDSFSQSDFVRQRGYSFNWAHRLTPISSLNLGISRQRSKGSLEGLGVDLDTYAITWSSRLGKASTVSVGARHSSFDSDANPYSENVISASLGFTF